jgi:ribonuclease Z
MTLADASLGKVDVIGPQGLTHFIAAMRKYVFRYVLCQPVIFGVTKPPLFRDYLAVIPTEVPIKSAIHDLSKPPDPFYKDENVTVYAIPIIPVHNSLTTAGPSAIDPTAVADARIKSSSKRKRTPSPTSTSKRSHHLRGSSTSSNHAEEPESPSIQDLAKRSGFNPRYLEGKSAHEWREFMVQTVFSQRRMALNDQSKLQTPANKGQDAGEKRGQYGNSGKNQPSRNSLGKTPTVEHNSGPEQRTGSSPKYTPTPHHVPYPRGFNNQLPTFSLPHRQVTNTPDTKPTLAYVVVGPRIRGKFDAVKAKELGVPNGSQRRDLTQGKTIRFMVPDGKGGTVERVVRPEEIIGESENPSVRIAKAILKRGGFRGTSD